MRDDIDARLASRIITYYYGIDGLLRTREVFGWSLKRSNEWLLAHASAAVLRSPLAAVLRSPPAAAGAVQVDRQLRDRR
ncbi:MAG: hypothetical protein ACRDPD_11840 [Streptosporangiaceae bacterium]